MNELDDKQMDEDVRRLLELAGPRQEPPELLRARVHAASLQAWEELPEPSRKARFVPIALAATVLVSMVAALLLMVGQDEAAVPVGRVVHVQGRVDVRGDGSQEALAAGTLLTTQDGSSLAVTMGASTSLRLSASSSATIQGVDEVWLHQGRIYLDVADGVGLRIVTPRGTVTDIGTQFEVALGGEKLEVAVREGGVQVEFDNGSVQARANEGWGELLRIDAAQQLHRQPLSATDARWQWVVPAGGSFTGATVHDYLAWAARESGIELDYRRDIVRVRAQNSAFTAPEALPRPAGLAALISDVTDFRAELDGHRLLVDFKR